MARHQFILVYVSELPTHRKVSVGDILQHQLRQLDEMYVFAPIRKWRTEVCEIS